MHAAYADQQWARRVAYISVYDSAFHGRQ